MKMTTWQQTRHWLLHIDEPGIKIASHRGKFSSSVIENTSRAFLIACGQGADMVEMDLAMTSDGVLVGHHDPKMGRLLHVDEAVSAYSWERLKEMPVYNYYGEINVTGLETFDEILHSLKDQTILVLDRCWDYLEQTYQALCRADMVQQAVFKFHIANEEAWSWAAEHPDCVFIPMVKFASQLPLVEQLSKHTTVAGVEILPKAEEDDIFSAETAAWLKEHRMRNWCNSLSYAKRLQFGVGHDDLLSMGGKPEEGWGYLIGKGVDIIQTDWPMEVAAYLQKTGNR